MTITLSRKTLAIMGVIGVFVIGLLVGLLIDSGEGKVTTVTELASAGDREGTSGEADTVEATETAQDADGLPDCVEAGIADAPRREGICDAEGQKAVVVNEDSTLELKELKVDLLGIEKTKSVTSEFGETKSASGTFVIFTLEVTNRTNLPTYFDSNQSQVFLYINDNIYTQDFDVENYALDDSFLNQYEEVQPKGNQIGTVAFDVPDSVLPGLEKSGNLDIINFSEEEAGLNAHELGTIRTYQ